LTEILAARPQATLTARPQLSDQVAAYVRELIISGAVRSGEFLRMERIASEVGVSNTPVREGLLSLRGEGFVRLVPRRGFVVAPFGPQDIRDLFWAQAQLAGELSARAAKKMDRRAIDRLQANLHQYDQAIAANDKELIASLGHLFHREINLAAESNRLTLLLALVVKQLPNRFYATIEGQVQGARDEHPLLLEAMKARAARKARNVMEQHILDGADRLIATLERRGLWGD
jgi:DNA-binding GntR family transcriptional regulator